MKKIIVLISMILLLTSCSTTTRQTHREVPTITFEQILRDENLIHTINALDEESKPKFKFWLKEKLIPYVSYLETELEYSTID